MRVDRHVPLVSQILRRADVVEVPVGEHDGVWGPAEILFSPVLDAGGGERDRRVDQRPRAVLVRDARRR